MCEYTIHYPCKFVHDSARRIPFLHHTVSYLHILPDYYVTKSVHAIELLGTCYQYFSSIKRDVGIREQYETSHNCREDHFDMHSVNDFTIHTQRVRIRRHRQFITSAVQDHYDTLHQCDYRNRLLYINCAETGYSTYATGIKRKMLYIQYSEL